MLNPLHRMCLALSLPFLLLGVGSAADPFRYKPGKHGTGELKFVDGVPVLILQGTPDEIGEQVGKLAASQTAALFRFPREYFLEEVSNRLLVANKGWTKETPAFKLALATAEKLLWPQVQGRAASLKDNFPAAYRAELKAIAAAVRTEVATLDQLHIVNGLFDLGHVPFGSLPGGCSSLIIPPNLSATGGLLFGRNLDFYHFGYLHDYSLVMVYRTSDPKTKHSFVSAGFPGFVGSFTGMNDAGLTIASHEVQDPKTTTLFNPKGLPFAMAYRRILEECATVGDAIKLLDSMDRASVTSLVIADPTGGAVIEVTPDTLAVRRFKNKPGVCTNHFCVVKTPDFVEHFDTLKRFDILESATRTKPKDFGVLDVHKAMHAARLLDTKKVDMTIQTFVFEPAAQVVHLRFSDGKGPATDGELKKLELKKLWGK